MRVIAGSARSMPLRTLKGMDIRPTTDRTKETLFNILQARIPGCRFLDLFAGSGAIGIEALSRGAECAWFVEKDRRTQRLIEENLTFTRLYERAHILGGDVMRVLPTIGEVFDVIFMDPPFGKELEKEALTSLASGNILAPGGMIVVEAAPGTDFSYLSELGYGIVNERVYGHSMHLFLKAEVEAVRRKDAEGRGEADV